MSSRPPEIAGLVFVRALGSGGYSDVYLYQQQLPHRPVAVKVLKEGELAAKLRTQLTAEANAMAGLSDHPNIVPVFAADVADDGRPYIVMQFYSRPNLGVRAASERLGVAEVLRIGVQIASAVETAHRAGILHRDIKPANILTSQYGAPGLTDFGIAAQVASVEEDDEAGVSVPWSPPEVLYATGPASVRSDVYSLAATLWHLLAGRSPFEVLDGANDNYTLMKRIRDVPPPRTGRADVPDQLDRLLQQAMSKDPQARPATALDFARALLAIEQTLQLPRTEIVVLDDAQEPTPAEPATGEVDEATRLRGVTRVAGQPPIQPPPISPPPISPPPISPPPTAPATTRRPTTVRDAQPAPLAPDSQAEHTIRKPRTVDPTAPSAEPAAAPKPSRTPYLIGAGVAVVAIAVIAGFVAFGGGGGGGGSPQTAPTISTSRSAQDPGVLGEDEPPGPVKVTAAAASGHAVTFRWSYSAALANDTFLWRTADASKHGATTKPTLTLANPKGTRLCIEVKVVRADGSNGSAIWSAKGCAT
ncbi:serine/threonine-protein kinase [Jatrophihabitans sp.]|uniref:serine/threonine-protein kinase n=1 Tax=Jatrophihabitans sp. TaxID=1932789 RepID=UPI0030C6B0F5